jgi:uncharacterized protein with HEPN domain
LRDPAERLRDVLESITAIQRHSNCTKQAFEQDELLQTWFLRHLQIIGEAVRSIPDEIRALAPEIPWQQIAGMRNVLVHGYFEIDTDLVWDAAIRDVPALRTGVECLLASLKPYSE